MEKISCEVARDLLPLYCDEVCSKDSRRLVEEHLKDCPCCRKLLEEMRTECSISREQEQQDEEMVKHMASEWNQSVRKSFVKGILAALGVSLCLTLGYWGLTRWATAVVPSKVIEATVENVTDTQVEILLKIMDGNKAPMGYMEYEEDGTCSIVLKRGMIPVKSGDGGIWTEKYGIPRIRMTEEGEQVQVKEIYYGVGNDRILIWKETVEDQ